MRITDKHYNAIGRVSVSFSDVEIWISGFIWRLISQDFHIGQMITAEMSFSRQLIPLLCSLFRYRVSDNIKFDKFNKLINRLSKIAEDRDHLIHSNWLVESPNISSVTRLKITAKRKKGLNYSRVEMKPEDIQKIADNCDHCLNEFIDFMERTLGELEGKTIPPNAIFSMKIYEPEEVK